MRFQDILSAGGLTDAWRFLNPNLTGDASQPDGEGGDRESNVVTWRGSLSVTPGVRARYEGRGQRIDYFNVSESLLPKMSQLPDRASSLSASMKSSKGALAQIAEPSSVVSCEILGWGRNRRGFLGSDHCPVALTLTSRKAAEESLSAGLGEEAKAATASRPFEPSLIATTGAEDIEDNLPPSLMADPFNLQRFIAEQRGGAIQRAIMEIQNGRKDSHWSWFALPTPPFMKGDFEKGSVMNKRFAIRSDEEARAFLRFSCDGVDLGKNYLELMQEIRKKIDAEKSVVQLMGVADAPKLLSSAIYFSRICCTKPKDGHPIRQAQFEEVSFLAELGATCGAVKRACEAQAADWERR